MRFLMYNIRYGTGRRPGHGLLGYLRRTSTHLASIAEFIGRLDPDIVGLVEVDAGSYRSRRLNQAQWLALQLGHYHSYGSKYGADSMAHRIPILNKQGNAFLTKNSISREKFHYFSKGIKKLVIELELEEVTFFLVHLALGSRARQHQMGDLYALVKNHPKPVIVAGDFNALWGEQEITLFLAATGLVNANQTSMPSFPSWAPRRHLDFVLHSPSLQVNRFWMPSVTLSDHLPLVFDFTIPAAK